MTNPTTQHSTTNSTTNHNVIRQQWKNIKIAIDKNTWQDWEDIICIFLCNSFSSPWPQSNYFAIFPQCFSTSWGFQCIPKSPKQAEADSLTPHHQVPPVITELRGGNFHPDPCLVEVLFVRNWACECEASSVCMLWLPLIMAWLNVESTNTSLSVVVANC